MRPLSRYPFEIIGGSAQVDGSSVRGARARVDDDGSRGTPSPPLTTDAPGHRRRRVAGLALGTLLASSVLAGSASAASAATVGLGTASSFGVLAGSTVTNTGPSVIGTDIGVTPGTAITGFPPGTVSGAVHANDAVALQAQSDLTTAYGDAAGRPSSATVTGDLGGRTLTPGVYTSATSLGLTGDLTLNAQGDPNAVFVFQAGSTLTTASGSRVVLTGGAQACNVFWQVGSSATIGTSSTFRGSILALTSISVTTGATIDGRALARNGAVTLDTDTITQSACTTPVVPVGGSGGSSGTSGGSSSGTPSSGTPSSGTTTTTGADVPVVVTGGSTVTGSDRARVGGRVVPGSTTGQYGFQYGTTRKYGRRTPLRTVPGDAKPFSLRVEIRGLRPGRLYHYRIFTTDRNGHRTTGRDRTFRTPAARVRRSSALPPRTSGGFTG